MSITALSRAPAAFVPLRLQGQPHATRVLTVIAATAFLTLCSYISVPMPPVPVTMQTFAVTVVGAVFGWRLGAVAVLAWLAEAAIGLPVLSNGHGGVAYMMGPTGGYLLSFPIVAALVGWCAEKGVTVRGIGYSLALMVAANALMLIVGAAWLAAFVGSHKAIALGVTPFLLGGLLKAALAATSLEGARRLVRG